MTDVDHGVQASNEFELDGQRVVLIDAPGFGLNSPLSFKNRNVMELIKDFLAESYVKT